jgi:hypothetical protein
VLHAQAQKELLYSLRFRASDFAHRVARELSIDHVAALPADDRRWPAGRRGIRMMISMTFERGILYLLAASLVVLLVYAVIVKYRAGRSERNVGILSAAIVDYFRQSGVTVAAECISRGGGPRFVAFIDSEPLKRFRYSHIVELSLRKYVTQMCGLELEKVYWRFPVKITRDADPTKQAVADADKLATDEDSYMNERLLRLKVGNEYEVTNVSWEQFEQELRKETRQR